MKAWQGQGAYGAVYRAERVGWRRSEPGALKVSLLRWDWRMEREVALLSRLSHPSIPRLLDRGGPQSPAGDEYPFFVMEWVQGKPLYAWAEQYAPSGKQVCRVLAQLARALEAVHAVGAVHRDVKGANIVVRLSDRLPVLIDFGSCHFAGAQRLTWQSLPPVTPEYLSPQAGLFYLRLAHQPDSYYPPSPEDDLYALGVTAFRLVMGQYPAPLDAQRDEQGSWRVTRPDSRPLLESNPRVEPRLREVILRLLSEAPEVRGTATQAATELEAVANELVPPLPAEPPLAAEVPPPNVPDPSHASERLKRVRPPATAWAWKPWLAMAAVVVVAVCLWNVAPVPGPPQQRASDFQPPDAGTSTVGDTSPTQPQAPTQPSEDAKPVAQQPLPEPRPGQIRPDKSGQCPGNKQVPINGVCWIDVSPLLSTEECMGNGGALFKGKCYDPVHPSPKKPQPTSNPPEAR